MPSHTTLQIRQTSLGTGKHTIRLTLVRPGQPPLEGEATITFALTLREQEDLRWYMEDYLQRPEAVQPVQVEQIVAWMKRRGIELYERILEGSQSLSQPA